MCEEPNGPEPEKPLSFSAIQALGLELPQRDQRYSMQKKQRPLPMVNGATTRSAARSPVIQAPTAATFPLIGAPSHSLLPPSTASVAADPPGR